MPSPVSLCWPGWPPQGELIRVALEHQMIEKDRSLSGQMIQDFGRQPGVANVMLLDRLGVVKYMSGTLPGPQELRIDSPTCQACHALPPQERNASQAIETREGTVLRTMVPIKNHDACYRCHDAAQRVNGILVFDLDVSPLRAAMNQDFRWMVAGSGALIFVLVAGIALLLTVVVVRRLQRVESTARRIVSGELEQRVPDEGSDTISYQLPLVPPVVRTAAVDPDGRLWVSFVLPYTYVFEPDGEKVRTVQFRAAGLLAPSSLRFASGHRVLVTPGCYLFASD